MPNHRIKQRLAVLFAALSLAACQASVVIVAPQADETTFVSVANLNSSIDLAAWVNTGWRIGETLGDTDPIPGDCALHVRQGVAYQVYARCAAGAPAPDVPRNGADFVYLRSSGKAAYKCLTQ